MSGRPKFSEEEFKWLVSQCNSRAELKQKSGLSRWTISRYAGDYHVDLATAFDHSATHRAEQSPQAVECAASSALTDRPKLELKRNFGEDAKWLEAADGAGNPLSRMKFFAAKMPGPYFIFCRETSRVVASTNTKKLGESKAAKSA